VLYDVPAHRGVEALPAGNPIFADQLLAIEGETGIAQRRGLPPLPRCDSAAARVRLLAALP